MDNFNLRKFLTENKLTRASRIEEATMGFHREDYDYEMDGGEEGTMGFHREDEVTVVELGSSLEVAGVFTEPYESWMDETMFDSNSVDTVQIYVTDPSVGQELTSYESQGNFNCFYAVLDDYLSSKSNGEYNIAEVIYNVFTSMDNSDYGRASEDQYLLDEVERTVEMAKARCRR